VDSGLRHEEITTPLLTWMIATVYSTIEKDLQKLKEQGNLTREISKTLIFLSMFHGLYQGKHKDDPDLNIRRKSFAEEKKALRKIAYLKQIFPEFDEEKIKIHLGIDLHDEERTGSSEHSHYSILNDVLETYLIYKKSSKQVEFSHKSLQEFLIAEHYLEQYFNGNDNLRLLNVSKPSKTTIDFLKGLIQILSLSSGNEVSKKYLGNDPKDQFGLFSSIISDDHNNNEGSISLEYIKETVAANAKKAFRLKSLPSVNILTAKKRPIQTGNGIFFHR
jgi:hypothetical protein